VWCAISYFDPAIHYHVWEEYYTTDDDITTTLYYYGGTKQQMKYWLDKRKCNVLWQEVIGLESKKAVLFI
jgi:hypothetical protein